MSRPYLKERPVAGIALELDRLCHPLHGRYVLPVERPKLQHGLVPVRSGYVGIQEVPRGKFFVAEGAGELLGSFGSHGHQIL